MTDVMIASAARTPIGSFGGALASVPAADLGRTVIEEALKRAGISGEQIDETIMGHVLQANQGQNTARQAGLNAGIPKERPAVTINQVCGSGLRAVAMAAQTIKSSDASAVMADMSLAPHAAHLRDGQKMGGLNYEDTMIKDGLWDAFNNFHMGQTAENLAQKYEINREEQDRFAVNSQNKAEAAQKAGKFKDEITPVTIKHRKGDIVFDTDEYIRAGATVEGVSGLRPAFVRDGGTNHQV